MEISAIVSAYMGASKYLRRRIENLHAQSLEPEIIVVCQEGSTEHAIAQEALNSRIIHRIALTSDVPTVYKAWNMGIQRSTGEFITNANSDDVVYPGALGHMVDMLKAFPEFALVYANCDIVNEYEGPPVNRFEWIEGGLDELLKMCFIGPMPVWRRSLHEKYGFFDEEMRSAGDYEFWLRLASSGEKFLHSKRCVGAFLSDRGTASRREPLRSTWEVARARSRYSNKEMI
jgi:glycosyltransferase involved in cell wall biosynthesis